MKFRLSLFALGLSFAIASTAAYAEPGNVANGKVLGYTCDGCHGIEGYKNAYPTYSVPKVGGQNVAYLISALDGYANGDRPHTTMHAQAASLSAADRADIATFFAASPVRASGQPVGTAPAASASCVACHGADGVGSIKAYPNIAGQHRDYLERALRDYKSGKRKNPIMAGIIAKVEEKDIPALARFFAAQKSSVCNTNDIREKGKCQ